MSGYSQKEMLQLRVSDLDSEEKPEETAERIQRIVASGK